MERGEIRLRLPAGQDDPSGDGRAVRFRDGILDGRVLLPDGGRKPSRDDGSHVHFLSLFFAARDAGLRLPSADRRVAVLLDGHPSSSADSWSHHLLPICRYWSAVKASRPSSRVPLGTDTSAETVTLDPSGPLPRSSRT